MAGNPLIISPDRLKDEGLLARRDEADLPAFPVERWILSRLYKPKFPAKESLRTLKPTLHLCSKGICGFLRPKPT